MIFYPALKYILGFKVERRVVYTSDPQYPSLTLSGNLPRLVVHVNEQKMSALRAMYAIVMGPNVGSPAQQDVPLDDLPAEGGGPDEPRSETCRLVIMQFTVQHLALEVGWCIACGRGVISSVRPRPRTSSDER